MKTWIKIDLNRAFGKNLVWLFSGFIKNLWRDFFWFFVYRNYSSMKTYYWFFGEKICFKVFGPKWTQNKVFQVIQWWKGLKLTQMMLLAKIFLFDLRVKRDSKKQSKWGFFKFYFSSFMSNWKICFKFLHEVTAAWMLEIACLK